CCERFLPSTSHTVMIDSVGHMISNFFSHLSGGQIAWYIFVLVCLLIFTRCRLLVRILCWVPLILTVCYIVFGNRIDYNTQRSRFLNGFVSGIDMRSANVSPGDLLATLNRALERYNAVMFDVHSDSLGVAAISMEDMPPGTASSDPRIPIFEEVMDLCRRKNAKVVVKVRHYNHQLFTDILDYVKRYNLFPHVVVTSHNPVVPYMIKRRESQILTGLSYSRHGITSRFAKTEGDSHFYKYLGQFLDDAVQFAVQHFILPKFVGSDILFVDQDDISLNLIKAATSRNITVVGTLVDGAGEESWMTNVAKIPYFMRHFQ
ncbi:hypothetical protein V3C99_016487, partial [Haemonchus contortus]